MDHALAMQILDRTEGLVQHISTDILTINRVHRGAHLGAGIFHDLDEHPDLPIEIVGIYKFQNVGVI